MCESPLDARFDSNSMKPVHFLMGLAVPVIWGLGFVFAKAALDWFPPILLMACRFAITALALVWFVKVPTGIWKRLFLISLVAATIQYSLTFTGLKSLDASTAVLIIQLEVPFMVIMAAAFLGERITLAKVVGIAIAFAGVVLIAGAPGLDGFSTPLLILLAGVLCFSIGQVMIRSLGYPHAFGLIAWMAVLAAPQLFLVSWFIEGNPIPYIKEANLTVWMAVIYMGLVMTALGYGLWYKLLAHYPVPRVSPFLLLLPVVGAAGSVIFLGESMSPRTALGGAIVICGVAWIVFQERREHSA